MTDSALRDEILPAMLAAEPTMDRQAAVRLLLRVIAEKMAEARGVALFSRRYTRGRGAALRAAQTWAGSIQWGEVEVTRLGDLYVELIERRRQQGSYYTPLTLGRQVVAWAFPSTIDRAGIAVLDPAMGCGHFLIAAAERLAGEGADSAPRWEVARSLYGADRDEIAVEVARIALWLWAAHPGTEPEMLAERLHCGDALRDELWEEKFDAVIGNPPYASVFTRARGATGGDLAADYATARGSFDLVVPFVERAIQLTKESGRCGLVLPNKLLAADYARALRRWLGERAVVEIIADFTGEAGFGADVYPVVCVFHKAKPQSDAPLRVQQGAEVRQMGRQADLWGAPGDVWSAALDEDYETLRRCWEGDVVPLGEVAKLCAGLTVDEAYRLREAVIEAPPNWLPEGFYPLITSGLIQKGRITWGQRRTQFLKRAFRRPVVAARALPDRRRAQAAQEKIILAGLALEPRAAYDRGMALASVGTIIITEAAWPLPVLCALLNSQMVARLYRALFGGLALAGGYLRFGKRELAMLPVPKDLAALPPLPAGSGRPDQEVEQIVRQLYRLDERSLPPRPAQK